MPTDPVQLDAVILAGGKMDKELEDLEEVKRFSIHNKAFIPVGDKFMVEHVLDVLLQSPSVNRAVLVTDREKLGQKAGSDRSEEAERMAEFISKVPFMASQGDNILASLESGIKSLARVSQPVLVVPCDIPLITPEAVEDFICNGLSLKSDIVYGYLSRRDSERRYPEVHHTYVKLREGEFCGTGFFLINPQVMGQCRDFFLRITVARKNPLKLANLLGLSVIFKYMIRQLTVADIEKRAGEMLSVSARGYQTPYPESAFNIDAPNELRIARQELK